MAKQTDRTEAFRRASHRRRDTDAVPVTETGLRSRPIRITIDLVPEQHRALARWTAQAAVDLDRARLPLAEVIRAAVRLLDDDQAVSDAVVQQLRQGN